MKITRDELLIAAFKLFMSVNYELKTNVYDNN